MAMSETTICNLALGRIGAKRINTIDDNTNEAIQCRVHYAQSRDALLRSHPWKFATARAALSEDTQTPAFEWAHAFILPSDCHRVLYLFEGSEQYAIEGQRLLTNDSSVDLVYTKLVTDPTKFDALFVETLALMLAVKLVMPLSQDKVLRRELQGELSETESRARLVNLSETVVRDSSRTWNNARYGSGIV